MAIEHDRIKERAALKSSAKAAAVIETSIAIRDLGPLVHVGEPSPRGKFTPSNKTLRDRLLEEKPVLEQSLAERKERAKANPRLLDNEELQARGDERKAKELEKRLPTLAERREIEQKTRESRSTGMAKRVTAQAHKAKPSAMTLKARIEIEGVRAQFAPAKDVDGHQRPGRKR